MYGFSLRMGEYIWTIENWPRELFFFFPWWKIPPNRVENESYSRKTVTCEILVFYFQMDSHPEGINIFESKILEIYHRKLFFINVLHLELLLGLIFYNYQKIMFRLSNMLLIEKKLKNLDVWAAIHDSIWIRI